MSEGRRPLSAGDAITVALMLAAVLALKRFHARATAEDLRWILAPSAAIAGFLAGAPFVPEANVGFVSTSLRFAIVPACAGVNFLAIAFCTLLTVLGLGARGRDRIFAVAAAAALAFATAVVANGIRIAVAVFLHVHRVELGPLDPARLHRLEGMVVYLGMLLAIAGLARRLRERRLAA